MRYEDSLAAIQAALNEHGVSAFNEREAPRRGLALGSTRIGDGENDWRLLVMVQHDAAEPAAQRAVATAQGHAVVVEMLTIEARTTRNWAQQRREILEIGQQIKPEGANWVGTGGLFIRDGDEVYQITNEHVVGMGRHGHWMEQGGERYGVASRIGGIGPGINRYDIGATMVKSSREILPRFSHGLDRELAGIRDVGPADVGRLHVKTGRTTGTTGEGRMPKAPCLAVGIVGLEIAYDHGNARFDGIASFATDAGKAPFSQPGDSGSTIICVEDAQADALLFAGGPSRDGRDWTFACPMASAIRHIGLDPTLA